MRGEMAILGSDFDAWVRGFEGLAEGPSLEMRAEWTAESEQMFADSQAFAHIDTGYNKSTGTVDVDGVTPEGEGSAPNEQGSACRSGENAGGLPVHAFSLEIRD